MKIQAPSTDNFNHVAKVQNMDDLAAAIQPDEINLSYAPLNISSEAIGYINNLDLSENGDFRSIVSPRHDPSIGPWKSLFFYEITEEKHLDTNIITSHMTQMPNGYGKDALASTLNHSLKVFWEMKNKQEAITGVKQKGIHGGLMLKYPTPFPKFHLDDSTEKRGLVFLRGNPEHGGMFYLENNAVNIWQRQENGYSFKNPIGPLDKDDKGFEVEEHQMRSVPMYHMSIHKGIVYKKTPALFYHSEYQKNGFLVPQFQRNVPDVMYRQNPLVHSEPTREQCPEPRLIWLIGLG